MFKRFSKWLKFYPKAGTADHWTKWERQYRSEAPIRYFITHNIPQFFYPVNYHCMVIKDWFRYRILRYHVLDTGLKPGWNDKDTLLLHVNFNVLKDFVECELALLQEWGSSDCSWKHNLPFYTALVWRSPEQGLKHLAWAGSLDNPASDEYDELSYTDREIKEGEFTQASSAREVKALYYWWIETRPNRQEVVYPVEQDYSNESILYTMSDEYKQTHANEYKVSRAWSRQHAKQQEAWHDEDDEMLIRLMKVRRYLWS